MPTRARTAAPIPPDAEDTDLPRDDSLCPGEALHADHLRRLLRVALPDAGQHKAAGWFGQTDFLFTRRHVDEDQDAYHDALFITIWKRWDFWLGLPDAGAARANLLSQAWARLRQPVQPAVVDGLQRQYRRYDASGRPGPWQPLAQDAACADALQACTQAWRGVIDYWRLAEGQRRAGRPLRARLHAALTPERVRALTLLPVFTLRYNDWYDPERNGWWQGEVWVGARQLGQQGVRQSGRALKLCWRNGNEQPGDEDDDAHACYQIDMLDDDAQPPGTAHPPGLLLSCGQRQSDTRRPLGNDAVQHMARLLRLFTDIERQLHTEHEREQRAPQSCEPNPAARAPALPCPSPSAPDAPDAPDATVLGPAVMALSDEWQAMGRSHAALVRAQWADRPAAGDAATSAPGADAPPPLADPRVALAPTVLQLARTVHARADADLWARFHRRFGFAPGAHERHAAGHGRAVERLLWRADGTLLARVAAHAGAAEPASPAASASASESESASTWWQVGADGQSPAPLPRDQWPATPPTAAEAMAHGVTLRGGADGDLLGLAQDGGVLWRHRIGGAIRHIAPAPDGHGLAVGTAGGYLVLLRRSSATDPYLVSTSRYVEAWRLIFWDDAPEPLLW